MKTTPRNKFELRQLSVEEGGGYLVTFPELPGCMSDGETVEEAIINAADAEKEWLLASKDWDKSGINAGDKIIEEFSDNAFVIKEPIDFFSPA